MAYEYASYFEDRGYTVYIVSGGGVKYSLIWFETEEEAEEFCDQNNWEWMDENGFVWYLEIEEE